MKKFLATALALCMMCAMMTSCGKSNSPAPSAPTPQAPAASSPAQTTPEGSDWPKGETLEIWVPAGAGTAQDIWCRLIADKMAKRLDCTVIVENKPGGNGWICINEFLATEADGTRILSSLLSQVGSGRNPTAFQEAEMWNDLDLLGSMMDDPGCLWIRADETRFTDLDSLIKYAQQNEVIVNITAAGSDDDVPLYWLNSNHGTKITPVVNSDGTAGCLSNLLGGHVDFLCDNLGAYSKNIGEGTMVPLCIFSETRSDLFPDVPTVYELLDEGFTVGNTRGMAMQKGTPEERYNVIQQAFQDVLADPELVADFLNLGYAVNYRDPEDFGNMMEEFANTIDSYAEWLWGDK